MQVLRLLRLVGGLALLSASASFVFRQAWHMRVGVAARPFVDWWLATMAITGNPLIMAGVTGVAFALIFGLTAGVVMSFLFGAARRVWSKRRPAQLRGFRVSLSLRACSVGTICVADGRDGRASCGGPKCGTEGNGTQGDDGR